MVEGRLDDDAEMNSRVVLLAIDAMDANLVSRGIRGGWLPTMARLVDSGRTVMLGGPQLHFPGSTWPTVNTATGPEEHLLIFDRQLAPGSCEIEHVSAARARRPPFWKYVSDAGLLSTIVSVYGAQFVPSLKGTQVIGWGSYDPFTTKMGEPHIEPSSVARLLEEAIPDRRAGFLGQLPDSIEGVREYLALTLRGVEAQTRALALLLDRGDWDFFFGAFPEPHEAGHFLWHFADSRCPEHGLAPSGLEGAMEQIYAAVDSALAVLIEHVPSDAVLFVFSPHGMGGPSPRIDRCITEILERGGWLARDSLGKGKGLGLRMASGGRSILHKVAPVAMRKALGRLAPEARLRMLARLELSDVDWGRTRAFSLPHDQTSLIRFNRKGREPFGIVEPGVEYDGLCEEIEAVLKDLIDLETGKPAAREIVRVDSLIGSPIADVLPDLCVLWADKAVLQVDSQIGRFESRRDDIRTGDHTPIGFMIGVGPGIEASRVSELLSEKPDASIIDIGPTVLARLGIAVSSALPGHPIEALATDATT